MITKVAISPKIRNAAQDCANAKPSSMFSPSQQLDSSFSDRIYNSRDFPMVLLLSLHVDGHGRYPFEQQALAQQLSNLCGGRDVAGRLHVRSQQLLLWARRTRDSCCWGVDHLGGHKLVREIHPQMVGPEKTDDSSCSVWWRDHHCRWFLCSKVTSSTY